MSDPHSAQGDTLKRLKAPPTGGAFIFAGASRTVPMMMHDEARQSFFDDQRRVIADYYLADPDNPYQQSGRSTGAARWEETRRPVAAAVHTSGSFLDVGCANGLLLESVERWVGERGIGIDPHGVDFVPELIDLARRRVPHGTFHVANAWDWSPPQRYTFVRTSVETVPHRDRVEFVRRQHGWVAPGGRIIVCWYPDRAGSQVDVLALVAAAGLELGGVLRPSDHTIVWAPGPPS